METSHIFVRNNPITLNDAFGLCVTVRAQRPVNFSGGTIAGIWHHPLPGEHLWPRNHRHLYVNLPNFKAISNEVGPRYVCKRTSNYS